MPLRHDRFFNPDPSQKAAALDLYEQVRDLPLICPHGHVDPRLFAENKPFPNPAALFITPDHYVFRMLYSQGVSLESLGIRPLDGSPYETDPRTIWRTFAAHWYLFRGTPTALWLTYAFETVFGIEEKLSPATADAIYDQIAAQLAQPDFTPRRLYERFNIEVLCTTDAATDTLEHHRAIRESGWNARILPTFRPDAVINVNAPNWLQNINALSATSSVDVHDVPSFMSALENRRAYFKSMGAVAADHAANPAYIYFRKNLIFNDAFDRRINGRSGFINAHDFTSYMMVEMASMSIEDGLVMQLHVGSYRNHNPSVFNHFGADMGADIPIKADFTHDLHALLEEFGSDPRLTLILFTLDESTYSRELAPLAGHYPALRIGPPWWFHDSWNGMRRYFDQVIETAGLYNTAGFNDDTRAFLSIPARHDVWRRAACDWLAGLLVRRMIDEDDAHQMAYDCAYGLAKKVYKL